MEFRAAINSFFRNYATFSGRATRSEFWWAQLFLFITGSVTGVVDALLFGVLFGTWSLFSAISFYGLLIPFLAVTWRRLHDIGKSGGFFFIFLTVVGIVILIVWLAKDSDPKTNKFGASTKPSSSRDASNFSSGKSKTPKVLLLSGIGLSLTSTLGLFWTNWRIDNSDASLPDLLCAIGNIGVLPYYQEDCPLTEAQLLQQSIPDWMFVLIVGIALISASIITFITDTSAASSNKSNPKTALREGVTRQQPDQDSRKCPMCAEDIKIEAKLCKHCGSKLGK